MSERHYRPDVAALDRSSLRILVLGAPGAGKSCFAAALGQALGLPVYRLDDLYWEEGWRRPRDEEFLDRLAHVVDLPCGIIDGNYHRTLQARAEWANFAIDLDLPTYLTLFRFLRRSWRRRLGRETHLLPMRVRRDPNAHEPVSWRFLWFLLTFRRRVRPSMSKLFESSGPTRLIRLRSRKDVASFLEAMQRQRSVPGGPSIGEILARW